jgi:alpha-2-macroglobulin
MEEKPFGWIRRYRLPVIIAGVLLLAAAVFLIARMLTRDGTQGPVDLPPPDTSGVSEAEESGVTSDVSRLLISLSEGQAQPQAADPVARASGEPLTDEEIERIIQRLSTLTAQGEDQLDFNLPAESLPPPRTGETIDETFPPSPEDIQPETVEAGPLEVLRFAPEGEIPLAPFINITFNQPMVPLTSLEDLATEDVPARLEPSLPGTWRWVGTKTLTFQYDSTLIDRLPMATEYQVTVPAGTESATGGVLAEEVSWSFSTPPPKIVSKLPYDTPQPRDPLIFIAFDQRIDADAVLDIIQVTANGEAFSLRLATEVELEADKTLSRIIEDTPEGRWLAFRIQELLPADSAIRVSIPAGMPSAEGPLVTTQEQGFSFRTYAPLRIVEHGCSWSADRCPPLTPFYIRFNNPIESQEMTDGLLRIEPELPGASVNVYGDTIQINGASQGQTTYQVTVGAEIQDIFGQTLGRETTLSFNVGTAEPFLVGPDRILVTLDPAARQPILSLYTVNYNRLDVKIYAVEPADWPAFKNYLREYQRTDSPPSPPGRLVLDETMRVETPTDRLTEVGIDLSRHMDGDYGHFIVIARPERGLLQNDRDRYWEVVQVWVQITQIGLDAFADQSQMVVWTSALQDGAPLSDVTIESDSAGINGITGEDGVARIDLHEGRAGYLVARKGADKAILPRSEYFWGDDTWQRMTIHDELRWYVFDDRQMYRPGEEVHVKGWMRRVGGKADGDVSLLGDAVSNVRYRIYDPQGNELQNGEIPVNALGGFDFSFTLPENANLGYASLQLEAVGNLGGLDNTQTYHQFQIQEFRRPEFEVSARNESVGPYFVGGNAIVAVEAKYYAGGPLPNADVSWLVSSTPTNYKPPNWPDFTFGFWEPWWWYSERFYYGNPYGAESETFTGTTDATGNHYLRLDFEATETPRPSSVLAEATVIDVNRQAWAGTTSLLVHPADLYVGLAQ